jgi:iron-sulfur cluster assembly 1
MSAYNGAGPGVKILKDAPPTVIPTDNTSTTLSPDANAQTVAAPPPPPKAEKARPKIRATKAALTIVCEFCDCLPGISTYNM